MIRCFAPLLAAWTKCALPIVSYEKQCAHYGWIDDLLIFKQ
jgi:hypothetical protein